MNCRLIGNFPRYARQHSIQVTLKFVIALWRQIRGLEICHVYVSQWRGCHVAMQSVPNQISDCTRSDTP